MSIGRELVDLPSKDYVLEHLQCPICLQIPLPPIWICHQGHTTCDDCRPQLNHCGLCRDHFTDTRNFFMESIVMGSTFTCPYKDKGCDVVSVGNLLKEHKYNCTFGPKIKWVPCTDTSCPKNAVTGGWQNGLTLYVIRAKHNGSITPGKLTSYPSLNPIQSRASLCWGGGEHVKYSYEVLVAPPLSTKWITSSNGQILSNAVLGGISEDGENLYIGRVKYEDNLVNGKIHPSHGCCYIPYDEHEKAFYDYEILVEVGQD